MDYIPNTEKDLEEMLRDIGADSFERLVAPIPRGLRDFKASLPLPLTEMELMREMEGLAARNRPAGQVLSFLGAGAYEHFIPSAIDPLVMRGEFYTAYTPYQAEASQGTLQAIYEYQSLMCALTGMEVSNASLYDGASAVAEAGFLALNSNPGRRRIVISSSVHPESRATLKTYLEGHEVEIIEVPTKDGVTDPVAFSGLVNAATCAVIVQSPNYWGAIEPMAAWSGEAHRHGAFFVAVVNPISLGLLKPPGEYGADFAVGEGQPLGIPLSYGGPWLGFLNATKKLVHRISGRIVGLSQDEGGDPAFCLTLQAREQHIRREKATSNICTNQSLMALRACIYLALLGGKGMGEVSRLNAQRAHLAARSVAAIPGFSLAHPQPFFNEFTVRCPVPAARIVRDLEAEGVVPGLPLGKEGAGNERDLLVCATEARTVAEIARLAILLKRYATP